jgi:hypothetical protein
MLLATMPEATINKKCNPLSSGSTIFTFSCPKENDTEFLPEISRIFDTVVGFLFFTVFAPHAVC